MASPIMSEINTGERCVVMVNLSQLEIIACLMNGAHIVWRQPAGPGNGSYKVMFPGGKNPDRCIGRVAPATAALLWKKGFLVCDHSPGTTDKSGDILRILRLDKPSIPGFALAFSEEVSGDA